MTPEQEKAVQTAMAQIAKELEPEVGKMVLDRLQQFLRWSAIQGAVPFKITITVEPGPRSMVKPIQFTGFG